MAKWLDNTGLSYFWGKIKSLFVAIAPTQLSNTDLDSLIPNGFNVYVANGSAGNTNQPVPSSNAFGLICFNISNLSYRGQLLISGAGDFYSRRWNGSSWNAWQKFERKPNYKNLFVIKSCSPGYLLADGTVSIGSNREKTSAFIPVDGTKKYTIQVWDTGSLTDFPPWVCIQMYDSSKTLVGQAVRDETNTAHYTLTINLPSSYAGTAYIRVSSRWLSWQFAGEPKCKVMVEEGDTAHDYILAEEDDAVYEYFGDIGDGCYFMARNGVCVLSLYRSCALTGSWTDITLNCYIDERWRPRHGTVRAPVISQNNGGRCAQLSVGTDGSVHVSGTGGTAIGTQNCQGVLSWIV